LSSSKHTIRFAAGTADGSRSSVYSVWAQDARSGRATRSDVYVAARNLGGSTKVSLHQDGNWESSLTSEFVRRNVRLPGWTRSGSRHAERWRRPAEFHPGFTLAFAVRFPGSELRPFSLGDLEPTRVAWLPAPSANSFMQITLLLARAYSGDGWPGKNSMGTQLLDRIPLLSGETLFLVHHEMPMTNQMAEQMREQKKQALARLPVAIERGNPSLRAQFFGNDESSGYRFFWMRRWTEYSFH